MPRYPVPRAMIRWAARRADGLITVAGALKDSLVGLGVPPDRVTVLRNGVDLTWFQPPADRAALRAALGLTRPTLVSVGHLIERKGHHLAIAALSQLDHPDLLPDLLIVGDGPEMTALRALTDRLGLAPARPLPGRPAA
ncbi:MAG: glycosyltransferase [Pseudomonadota bacterium]